MPGPLSVFDERDRAGRRRDQAGVQRDASARRRDRDSEQRDRDAEERDLTAEDLERAGTTTVPQVVAMLVQARREAARDRDLASEDRRAGAGDRHDSGMDRRDARTDRAAGAVARTTAAVDAVTGAYERAAGQAELVRDIARCRRTGETLVAAFVDVDGLKRINDTYGHAAGDRILTQLVESLKEVLRPHDLVIRYGGDEFLCGIAGVTLDEASERFLLVNNALARTREQASVTVGLALLRAGETVDALIARADAALYAARERR